MVLTPDHVTSVPVYVLTALPELLVAVDDVGEDVLELVVEELLVATDEEEDDDDDASELLYARYPAAPAMTTTPTPMPMAAPLPIACLLLTF